MRSIASSTSLLRHRRDSVMASSVRRVVLVTVLVLLQGAGFLQAAKRTKHATVIIIGAGMSGGDTNVYSYGILIDFTFRR